MCLFKRDDQENSCNHDDCKKYYMFNKQHCMHNNIPPNTQNFIQPKQPWQVMSAPENLSGADNVHKKVKLTGDTSHKVINHDPQNLNGQFYQNLNFPSFQQMGKDGMVPIMINPYMQPKQDGVPPNAFLSFMPLQGGPHSQAGDANYDSSLMKNKGPKKPNVILSNSGNESYSDNNSKGSRSSGSNTKNSGQNDDGYLKEFQSKLFGLLLSQNQILIDLKERNDVVKDTLVELITEINSLKNGLKGNNSNVVSSQQGKIFSGLGQTLYPHQAMGNSSDTGTADGLLSYLYGANHDFPYQLILKNEFSLPLYRERNFKFSLMLVDKDGNKIDHNNKLTLTIGIYSSENPPKYIDCNTSGNKILKGTIEKDMVNGTVTFDKIQIKEVTSHFRNGWVFFVVYPKSTHFANGANSSPSFVAPQKIKPLILEKVIVKAKKSKDKDGMNPTDANEAQEEENEEEPSEQNLQMPQTLKTEPVEQTKQFESSSIKSPEEVIYTNQ